MNAWFMSAEIDRTGVVSRWEYPAGVTEADREFMARATEVLPAIARSIDQPGDHTRWMSARWFER